MGAESIAYRATGTAVGTSNVVYFEPRRQQIAETHKSLTFRTFILSQFPWSAELEPREFDEMLEELAPALHRYTGGDTTELDEIFGDWEATVDARHNRGLMRHLAQPNRTYVRWE